MIDRIYMQILDMSLQASVAIAVVMVVRLLLKPAPKIFSYALWSIVLLRLICPFSFEAPVSLVPDVESVSESYTLQDEQISPFSAGMAAYQAVGDALNGGIGTQYVHTEEIAETGLPKVVAASWDEVWILFGQYVWLAGITGLVIYSAVSYCKLRRKLIGSMPFRENIYLADHIDSPFVLGIFRPKIYLPSFLSADERYYIIAHEQYHIRRLDHLIKPVAYVALMLHWFNPVVWVAYVFFCKDMEMSCDEAVIKILGGEIRGDYAASLLNLATGRRTVAITPLAFGEGDTKGRIKNLLKWKKPVIWVTVLSVIVCAAVGICLLTDPLGAGDSRVRRITKQNGYSITHQETKAITLALSTDDLPDSIYSAEGWEFKDGEVTAYHDGQTGIYLKGARFANEGMDKLYFWFEFTYDLPKDSGQFLYPVEISSDGFSIAPNVIDGTLRTEGEAIPNAVKVRGQDGDKRIWFYVSTHALQQIDGAFEFDIRLNEITYLRDGAAIELLTSFAGNEKGGSVKVTDMYAGEKESALKLEVSVSKTDLSRPGKVLADKIAADWKMFDALPEITRNASSTLPGLVYIEADTWEDCEKAVGFAVANPLECIDWIGKTGYIGMESAEPTMPITHVKAAAHATRFSDRKLCRVDIQSGYFADDVKITMTATLVDGEESFTTGSVTHGYATYDRTDATTGSGIPVLVITTKRANNLGYYNDGWCDSDAYWVEGNVFYHLRVIGENPIEIQSVTEKLLAEI